MLRSFAYIAALCAAALPAAAQARQARLNCHEENYVCYTDNDHVTRCRWVAGEDGEVAIDLIADDRYPNASSPQRVFTGQRTLHVRTLLATLDIILIESPNGSVGYSNTLSLTMGSVTSETTGVTYLRNALRVHDEGVGYTCTLIAK